MSEVKSNFRPNFVALDGIRGIAALYVVIYHSRGHLHIGGSEAILKKGDQGLDFFEKLYYGILQLTALGSEFVILFFVLSGFSIAYSLKGKQRLGLFYLKRFIRLYPPYIAALVYAAVVYSLIQFYYPLLNNGGVSVFDNTKDTILNLVYINSGRYIAQFWSLPHEVLFYVIAPFCFFNQKNYYAISIVCWIAGMIFKTEVPNNIIFNFVFHYNIFFALGICVFNNYSLFNRLFLFANKLKFYLFMACVFLLLVVINVIFKWNQVTFCITALSSIFLIVNFQKYNITNSFIRYLGSMSYSLYLTHFASIYLFYLILIKLYVLKFEGKIELWWVWIVAVLFCVLMNVPFYIFVEKISKKVLNRMRGTNN